MPTKKTRKHSDTRALSLFRFSFFCFSGERLCPTTTFSPHGFVFYLPYLLILWLLCDPLYNTLGAALGGTAAFSHLRPSPFELAFAPTNSDVAAAVADAADRSPPQVHLHKNLG